MLIHSKKRVYEKRSSLKITKYDCANLPKIFLANNFEKKSNESI